MSQFPGRQHANGQRTYNPSSNSPFTTPERQQSGYQPSPASQTPSHRQLAERSLSRQMSGLSIPDNNVSRLTLLASNTPKDRADFLADQPTRDVQCGEQGPGERSGSVP